MGFLGGSRGTEPYAIATDDEGNIYVAGRTSSGDLPTTPGCHDDVMDGDTEGFVAKFDPTASTLVFATYLGGAGQEAAYAIDELYEQQKEKES